MATGTIVATQDPTDERLITVKGLGFNPNIDDAGLVMSGSGTNGSANLVGFATDANGDGSAVMYWAIAPAGSYDLAVYKDWRTTGGGLHYSHLISNVVTVVIT